MCKVMLILDKFFLKYEGVRVKLTSPQKKLPTKSPALFGLSDCNGTRTHNHLVRKSQIFSETGQMIELCCEYLLYGAFDRMFLSCHICVSRWIQTVVACLSDLNFRYSACFEQGVPWHSGNYRVDSLWNAYVTW